MKALASLLFFLVVISVIRAAPTTILPSSKSTAEICTSCRSLEQLSLRCAYTTPQFLFLSHSHQQVSLLQCLCQDETEFYAAMNQCYSGCFSRAVKSRTKFGELCGLVKTANGGKHEQETEDFIATSEQAPTEAKDFQAPAKSPKMHKNLSEQAEQDLKDPLSFIYHREREVDEGSEATKSPWRSGLVGLHGDGISMRWAWVLLVAVVLPRSEEEKLIGRTLGFRKIYQE
ncbi:uncharacterized protein VTP21DRAFT_7429 [Calcarisporiella thermophila]|uniref:uncharacterized protein n=1 Tax=Calcarisporiella thermophila TaxID=911321 RepID=UPI00374308B2